MMTNKRKTKTPNTKSRTKRAANAPTNSSPRDLFVAALAAHYALQACESARPEDSYFARCGAPEIAEHVRRSFVARGVKFTTAGIPTLPTLALDSREFDQFGSVDAEALLLALTSVSGAVDAAGDVRLRAPNMADAVVDLRERAFCAGAMMELTMLNRRTGAMVRVKRRVLACDAVTGEVIDEA